MKCERRRKEDAVRVDRKSDENGSKKKRKSSVGICRDGPRNSTFDRNNMGG